MNIWVEPGKYVVAVSGGIDSMVLLDILAKQPGLRLTVAHFDHGIREDSLKDRELVANAAHARNLSFVFNTGNLGADTSEENARNARYAFLRKVQLAADADAIITAHHQDDMLETAILNVLRGSGRRGVASLKSSREIIRPLLGYSKKEIKQYATENKITWREDTTNQNDKYLRNYIRHKIVPIFTEEEKQQLLSHITELAKLNDEIDDALMLHLHVQPTRESLDRHWFIMLPHSASLELMAFWLRSHGIRTYDRKMLERLVVAAKTLKAGKQTDIDTGHWLKIGQDNILLELSDYRGTKNWHSHQQTARISIL